MNSCYQRVLFNLLSIFVTCTAALPALSSELLSGEDLFKTPYYSNPQLSPDGNLVAGKRIGEQKRELVITDVDSQNHYPVVFFAKRNYLRNFYWIDNNSIFVQYISGRQSKQSIINLNTDNLADKSPPQQVEVEGYLLSPLPDKEDQVLYARRLGQQKLEIYQINTADLIKGDFSRGKKMENPLKNASFYAYDDKKQSYFGVTYDKKKRFVKVWFLAQDSDRWLVLHDSKNQDYELKIIQYFSNNKFLALTNKNSERMLVAIFDLETKEVEKVVYEHPQHDIIDADADEQTGELLSVSYINRGNLEVEYLQEEQAEFDNFIVDSEDDDPVYTVDTSKDGSRSILFAYGAAHPGTYVLFDEKKQTTKLIEHVYPNLIEHEFSKTRRIDMSIDSGESLEGFLTIPWQNGNGVLLVLMEPGSSSREKQTEFSRSVQYFANRGFAVLRVPYSSPMMFALNADTKPEDSINPQLESNVKQLVTQVKQQFDYQQACAMGTGYGAYSAMRLAMLYPADYQCVIGLFGIYDYQLVYSADNAYALGINQQTIKEIALSQAPLFEQSPVYIAQDFDKPVLMLAGENDDIAIPEQFNRMKYVLKKQTEHLEYYMFKNTGHGFDSWFEEQQSHAVMDEFLRRHLELPGLDTLSAEQAAQEYIKISDMFSFDTLTVNNPFKSLDYLKRASDLGHPRAMFNRGAHHHRGELVIKSIDKAIEWYKKASDAGFKDASFRLGGLYEDSSDVKQDLNLAYHYYLLADQQGYDATAGLRAAKYVCKGEVVSRNVELCTKLFDIYKIKNENLKNRSVKVTEDSEKIWRGMLAELMLAQGNTPEQQDFYKRLLKEQFDIVDVKQQFELVDQGLYSKLGMKKIIRSGTVLKAKINTHIGIRFKLHKNNQSTEKNAVLLRVLRTSDTEDNKVISQHIVQKWGEMHEDDWFVQEFLSLKHNLNAVYELQIFNLDADLLYSQQFKLRKDPKSRF